MSSFIARWLPSVKRRDTENVTGLDDKTVSIRTYLNGPDWWNDGRREILRFFTNSGPHSINDGNGVTIEASTKEDFQSLDFKQQTEQSNTLNSNEDSKANEDYYWPPGALKPQKYNIESRQVSFQPPIDPKSVYLNDSMIPSSPLHVYLDEERDRNTRKESTHNISLPPSSFKNTDNSYQQTGNTPLDFGTDPPSSPPAVAHDQKALQSQSIMDCHATTNSGLVRARPVYNINQVDHASSFATLRGRSMESRRSGVHLVKKRRGPIMASNEQPSTKKQKCLDFGHVTSDAHLPQASDDCMDVGELAHPEQPLGFTPRAHSVPTLQTEMAEAGRASSSGDRGEITKSEYKGVERLVMGERMMDNTSPMVQISPTIIGKQADANPLPGPGPSQEVEGRIKPTNDDKLIIKTHIVVPMTDDSGGTVKAVESLTIEPSLATVVKIPAIIQTPVSMISPETESFSQAVQGGEIVHYLNKHSNRDIAIRAPSRVQDSTQANVEGETHTPSWSIPADQLYRYATLAPAVVPSSTAQIVQLSTLLPSNDNDQASPTTTPAASGESALQIAEAYSTGPAVMKAAPIVDGPSRAPPRHRRPNMSERELFALFPNKGYNDAPTDVAARRSGVTPRTERYTSDDTTRGITTRKNNDDHVDVDATQRSRQSSSSSLSSVVSIGTITTPVLRSFGLLQEGKRKGNMVAPASRSVSPIEWDINNGMSRVKRAPDDSKSGRKENGAIRPTPNTVTPVARSENTSAKLGTPVKLTPSAFHRSHEPGQHNLVKANPTKSPYFQPKATGTAGMSAQRKGWVTRKRNAEERAARGTADDHGSEDELSALAPAPSSASNSAVKPTTMTKTKAKATGKAASNTKSKISSTKPSTKASSSTNTIPATSKVPAATNRTDNGAPPERMLSELDTAPIIDPIPLRTRHASGATIFPAPAPVSGKAGGGTNKASSGAPPINKALRKRMENKTKNKRG